ncbi:MAG: hypothetical protein LH606_18375 [Cytophagaceae bacterium]|nr:hypothetical protein [Cytophagaceae bacterium]
MRNAVRLLAPGYISVEYAGIGLRLNPSFMCEASSQAVGKCSRLLKITMPSWRCENNLSLFAHENATDKNKKLTQNHHLGVIVVENLPKAKPSPGMQARIEVANAFLRDILPENRELLKKASKAGQSED